MIFKKKRKNIVLQEDFGQLFQEFASNDAKEGQIAQGTVTGIEKDYITIDLGMKSEGRIPISEFMDNESGCCPEIVVGSTIDVFIERFEGRNGSMVLSRERALKNVIWQKLWDIYRQEEYVHGKIIGRVKGGFAVEVDGVVAFLPGSQVDVRPIRDISSLVGVMQPFQILKMDNAQGNVVVSRRAVLEASRKKERTELLLNIEEGMVLEGVVKNVTPYGVFVDLGSMDGLIHITDLAWTKVLHPSELLSVGQKIKVMVIKFNQEAQRISLGLKQLTPNPWEEFKEKYKAGTRIFGKVTTIADYGAFVELQPDVEGLVYHTEIDWLAKNIHPKRLLNVDDEVEVVVLDIDVDKHRISLSIKQCKSNPWAAFIEAHPVGTKLMCAVRNVTDFGVFIVPEQDAQSELAIVMLIPAVELSWTEPANVALGNYTKGQIIECVIISVDVERERIGASVRQLAVDPLEVTARPLMEHKSVNAKIVGIRPNSVDVELDGGVAAIMHSSELSLHREEQKTELYHEGDVLEVKVLRVDHNKRMIEVSRKALELEQKAEMMEKYGNSAGGNFSDVIGEAIDGVHGIEQLTSSAAAVAHTAVDSAVNNNTDGADIAQSHTVKTSIPLCSMEGELNDDSGGDSVGDVMSSQENEKEGEQGKSSHHQKSKRKLKNDVAVLVTDKESGDVPHVD